MKSQSCITLKTKLAENSEKSH